MSENGSEENIVIDLPMTPENVQKIGYVIGGPGKKVAVGRDAHRGSQLVACALISGLIAVGTEVWDGGQVATPVLAHASKKMDLFVTIGAPNSDEGQCDCKIYKNDGSPITGEEFRAIAKMVIGNRFQPVVYHPEPASEDKDAEVPEIESIPLMDHLNVGRVRKMGDIVKEYVASVSVGHDCNGSPMVVDCGCGVCSDCLPQLLAVCNCDVIGLNSHLGVVTKTCGTDNDALDNRDLTQIVHANSGTSGISVNNDGTKVTLLDEMGATLSNAVACALIIRYLRPGTLVAPVNITSLVEDVFMRKIPMDVATDAPEVDDPVLIWTDGSEENTVNAIRDKKNAIGITSDWHIIYSDHSLCPDGLYTAMIFSELAGKKNDNGEENSIRKLKNVRSYTVLEDKIMFDGHRDSFATKLVSLLEEIPSKNLLDLDGWTLFMQEGWVSIKFDSESPYYIKVLAESADPLYAAFMMDIAKRAVNASI